MARNQKHYDTDYKVQSVNLAKEIGLSKAARELVISPSTLNGWIKATREGRLISTPGSQTPSDAMSLAEEIAMLREQNKKLSKDLRLRFLAKKTNDGKIKGKLSLYCKVLNISRQAFYKYLERKDLPWKYDYIVNSMYEILNEDKYNDTYGRYRMFAALKLKHQDDPDFHIPGERTIYRIMEAVGLVHRPKRNPKGIAKLSYKNRVINSFENELNKITIITALAIFLVIAISFKSFVIPAILVMVIQVSVYVTMSIMSVVHYDMFYLALLIMQCILMGATVDYAIVFTNYYREKRQSSDIPESLARAYQSSIRTILTSGLIMALATAILGVTYQDNTIGPIVRIISAGVISAMVLIIVFLPSMLAVFDRFVIPKKEK